MKINRPPPFFTGNSVCQITVNGFIKPLDSYMKLVNPWLRSCVTTRVQLNHQIKNRCLTEIQDTRRTRNLPSSPWRLDSRTYLAINWYQLYQHIRSKGMKVVVILLFLITDLTFVKSLSSFLRKNTFRGWVDNNEVRWLWWCKVRIRRGKITHWYFCFGHRYGNESLT